MNVYIPFICLALGVALNWRGLPQRTLKQADRMTSLALFMLMVVIGINIGTSSEVMSNLDRIGLNCLIISFTALWCSVGVTVILEKSVMPLEKIRLQVQTEKDAALFQASGAESEQIGKETKRRPDPLIIIMPSCIAAGILAGYFFLQDLNKVVLDRALTVCLLFLYTGAGIMLGSNKSVFNYIRRLGFRVLFMPVGIFAGCLVGGFVSGLLLHVDLKWSVLSASGMGYYSLTGATMTENYGIEAGTYGFIVNILRDVLTVLFLPVLIRISKGSPIASGAGGCMDSMLVPVGRVVGPELSVVALISGTIITIFIPFWLPLGMQLLNSL